MSTNPRQPVHASRGTALILDWTTCWLPMIGVAWLLLIAAGCSQNPYLAGGPIAGTNPGGAWSPPQTSAVAPAEARLSELSRRVQLLDDNNRQLHIQLAQTEQQTRVYQDEADLLRKQLADVSDQLQSTAIAARDAQSEVRGMQASASLNKQGGVPGGGFSGATMRANTNLSDAASRLNLGGLQVENQGDTIRIVVPADQLFAPGTSQMHPQASSTLDPIAAQIKSLFPKNRIGIEGYTDSGPIYGGGASNPHSLTSAQAAAVLDALTRRSGIPAEQLFTVAQGANNPRQSNASPAGRAANRRVEFVIYP